MQARDRYALNVACLNCGQSGVFVLSEDGANRHRMVEGIRGDFTAELLGDAEIVAVCNQCQAYFDPLE
jgi:hypothetical protein